MTPANEPLLRICFALDAPPASQELFAATLDLAARLQVEVHGLFVEDVNLLRLAGLPFATEIGLPSCTRRPLSLESMERALKSMAADLRRTTEDVARRAGVPWTFHVLRGTVLRATLDFAGDSDLLLLSRRSLFPKQTPRATLAMPSSPTGRVLVVYDGSPASQRSLDIASQLGRGRPMEIVVLLSPLQPTDEASLRAAADACLHKQCPSAKIHRTIICTTSDLIAATRQHGGNLVLINWNTLFARESELESLVNQANGLVGLLR